jgi:gas vesicle protein
MPRHTLEEVVELARQVKDDMTSGRSRTKRKHQNSTSSFSSSTSSSVSSLKEDIQPQKDRKKKKVRDKEKANIGEEKVMEKKLLLAEAQLRL